MAQRRLLSIVNREQLRRVLQIMLDEQEFMSGYGIRAVSKYHRDHPYTIAVNDSEHRVDYEPAESTSGLIRRQFELAWANLVPAKLLADRISAEVPSLPRGRLQS